jgi:hypothetical protein
MDDGNPTFMLIAISILWIYYGLSDAIANSIA